jgi:hypothetical protein
MVYHAAEYFHHYSSLIRDNARKSNARARLAFGLFGIPLDLPSLSPSLC